MQVCPSPPATTCRVATAATVGRVIFSVAAAASHALTDILASMSEPEPRPPARVVAGVGALAAVVLAWPVLSTYLVNTEGPMGDATRWAPIVAAALTVVVGSCAFLVTGAAARWHLLAGVTVVAVVGVAAWVLMPTVVDEHESFVSTPNRTASCTGWQFRHYPPETFDASALDYCVGFEEPVDG